MIRAVVGAQSAPRADDRVAPKDSNGDLMSFRVIDAHQHVWDPGRARYDWLGPEMAPIDRAMSFDDLVPELRVAGIDFTIQVQSADNSDDTQLMRESAALHREVVGIVGFVPLDDAGETERTLHEWSSDSLMVGVRNLIHTKPDSHWLLRADVDDALRVLERYGVPLDIVTALPRHLEIVPIISERHPRLKMVIDHLGKPPIGRGSAQQWTDLIAAAAGNPLVHAKVSGLYSATDDPASWTTETIRPFFERAMDVFGPHRLMYGGDWPISVLAGGYSKVWNGLRPLFDSLDSASREHVLGRTAVEFYGIDAARLRSDEPDAVTHQAEPPHPKEN